VPELKQHGLNRTIGHWHSATLFQRSSSPFALSVAASAAKSKSAVRRVLWPSTSLRYAQAERRRCCQPVRRCTNLLRSDLESRALISTPRPRTAVCAPHPRVSQGYFPPWG